MVTPTPTPANDPTSPHPNERRLHRFINIVRNMTRHRPIKDRTVVMPARTTNNPSPCKRSAANRHPGQSHTRSEIDSALLHELANGRYVMHDLADHVFGHIVSTELARDILRNLVDEKIIQVSEVTDARNRSSNRPLLPGSDDAQRAIEQAFEDADKCDCGIRDTENCDKNPGTSTDMKEKKKQSNPKRSGGQKTTKYAFEWATFPTEKPLKEDQLVDFMNNITDRALEFAQSKLSAEHRELRHRLVAPKDKTHAVPLSYDPDGEDMRPDFLLLPIEAFVKKGDGFKLVNQKYVNFTAARMVGESKDKETAAAVNQMQRYARGLKRAQPWVHYVLALSVTRERVVFMRGDGSGTERVELMLSDGRGCIEFIRILLGLALADYEDLGQNPEVELEVKEQPCVLRNISYRSVPSRQQNRPFSAPEKLRTMALAEAVAATPMHPRKQPARSCTLSKRLHSEVDDGEEETNTKKRNTDEGLLDALRYVFYPIRVYGHTCIGMLFTACSIRGRGTTVFCILGFDGKTLVVLKMAWQDLERVAEQDMVMAKLTSSDPHPNVIVPIRTFQAKRHGMTCTTLGAIRGFFDEREIKDLSLENRVLTLSESVLKRPVKYFWGLHDFVRGLRGALLGHEYLTSIGILHRDISENNIVLGRRPDEERGYLIDLDMAILQDAEQPTPLRQDDPSQPRKRQFIARNDNLEPNNMRPVKALRTGTFPYMSYNVLLGRKHTHFDDVESFLYVLLLFFFSYAGPLSDVELRQADENGFVEPIGSGRLPHLRNWPRQYAEWADGSTQSIASQKRLFITDEDGVERIIDTDEFASCLEEQWPKDLHDPIRNLIFSSFTIFWESTQRRTKKSRTEVSHDRFIDTLDQWLNEYSDLEDKFSNCPFKQGTP